MFHNLIELVVICLWAAILALLFDNLFSSPLECTTYTPYFQFGNPTPHPSIDSGLANSICAQQTAQVVLVFFSIMVFLSILILGLARIFARVARKLVHFFFPLPFSRVSPFLIRFVHRD